MAVNERTRHDLYEAARRAMGDEAAETLMEMLPPVGWADVATKQDLDLRFAALEERLDLRFQLVDERFERQEARFDTKLHRELRRLEARFTATLFVGLTAFGVIDRAL